MKLPLVLALAGLALVVLSCPAGAQAVLGPCGQTEGSEQSTAAEVVRETAATTTVQVSSVPLPGERAMDFELTAVVGDEIKKIKLSDYQGMYRVLCFYPADFTFV
jgi:hypothetical protein